MPIFHKYKTLQIHIPKTAGTTISHIMGLERESLKDKQGQKEWLFGDEGVYVYGQPFQHILASEAKREIGSEIYNRYFKFSFVRNPWDRVVSELFWTNSMRKRKPDLKFEDFVKSISQNPSLRTRPQVFYLKGGSEIDMDYIGRFESLRNDWLEICDIINLPLYPKNKESLRKNLGCIINETDQPIFVKEDDRSILKLFPGEELGAFNANKFNKLDDLECFNIKIANSIKEINSNLYRLEQIPKMALLKYERMNIQYRYEIQEEVPELSMFEMDLELRPSSSGFLRPNTKSYYLSNLEIDKYHFNKINRKNYREYYNDKTKKIIGKLYEEDVDTFKYTF